MRDGKPTKNRLLIEAFKLFAHKPYDRVTFADLEEVTGLSRGAILYHIKTKENLFLNVVNKFIFDRNSVSNLSEKFHSNLSLFITQFIETCQKEKDEMLEIGISNVNNAMLNIEISAFYILPKMREIANEWLCKEKNTWEIVLKNAISKKEMAFQQFTRNLREENENISIPNLVTTLLKHEKNEKKVIEELEKLLEERKKLLEQEEK